MALDYSDAWKTWPGRAVTVSLVRSSGTTNRSVTNALKRAVNMHQDAFSGVSFTGRETVWNIGNGELTAGDVIQRGDKITDGSDVWIVESANLLTHGTRWRCVCSPGV